MIRLFIIDDHPYVADGIKYNLHPNRQGITVAGSASNVDEAIHTAKSEDLDLFILDLHLPGKDPFNNVNLLKKRFPKKKIIIFTCDDNSVWMRAMQRIGTDGYVTKDKEHCVLIRAIRNVYNGEKHFPDLILNEDNVQEQSLQDQVIELLGEDLSIKQIAEIFNQNYDKTNYLLSKIRQKFKVKTNWGLIAKAINKL
jgi:DNA-binding NarL/FixJ family response regulator